jgi:hypothetical protein
MSYQALKPWELFSDKRVATVFVRYGFLSVFTVPELAHNSIHMVCRICGRETRYIAIQVQYMVIKILYI